MLALQAKMASGPLVDGRSEPGQRRLPGGKGGFHDRTHGASGSRRPPLSGIGDPTATPGPENGQTTPRGLAGRTPRIGANLSAISPSPTDPQGSPADNHLPLFARRLYPQTETDHR